MYEIFIAGNVGRDIQLSLAETDEKLVRLEVRSGLASLRLVQTLDREHYNSALTVTVLCERTGDNNVFSLPVQIRIMDVNDNAPQFLSAQYSANISEMMVVGSDVMTVVALDNDQAGPFSMVEYSVVSSDSVVRFDNPLDGKIVLARSLDFEKETHHEVVIKATDKGVPALSSTATLTIHVEDADDTNPAFLHDAYTAVLPEDQGTKLSLSPADMMAVDQDIGLNSPVFYSFHSQDDPIYNFLELNSKSGVLYLTGDPSEADYLLPRTILIIATQYNNQDRSSATPLTILPSSNVSRPRELIQFLEHDIEVSILENLPTGQPVLTLPLNDFYPIPAPEFSINKDDLPNHEFSVTRDGVLILEKSLDYEMRTEYRVRVRVSQDGVRDVCSVKIVVSNVNDWSPAFK